MKVLFVCEGFNRVSVVAQPWRHIYEIAKRMKPLGHEVKILTDLANNSPRDESINGIHVRRVEKFFIFFKFEKLIEALDEEDADIINWFGGPLSTLYFSRMEKSFRQKIIWNMYKGKMTFNDFRNLNFAERVSLLTDVQYIYSIVPNFLVKRGSMSSRVSLIIVWSKRLKKYLQDIGVNSDKITVVPSGVDVESFKPSSNVATHDIKMKLGLSPRDQVVLYFGSLSSFRGLDVLVSAMNNVLERNVDAKLVVLARDLDPHGIDKFLRNAKKRDRIVTVSGILSQSDIEKFLSISDLVVLPFKSWPHQEVPLTILEAMSMGKVVISTTIPQVLEIVENNITGILIPPNRPDLLGQKIIGVLSNKDKYMRMSKAASNYVERKHGWDNVLKDTLEIFENASKTP